jgi:hypothetical protein
MQRISGFADLVAGGLFLRTRAYEDMRQAPSPFGQGLLIVVAIGLIIALAALVGTLLEWAASPDMPAVQETVYTGLTQMPWYREQLGLTPDFAAEFKRWYDLGWSFARSFLAPNPGSAAANIILTPLGLVVSWLIYGLLAHFFARLLRGEAHLGQTLGCTALALAPHILKAAEVVPFLAVGGVVGTWTLLGRYLALKQAHRLTWGRALGATLLPLLVLGLLGVLLAALGVALFGTLASQFLGGGA